METKTCRVCGTIKPLDEMATKGRLKSGERQISNTCKKCANKQRELARKANKSEAREASNKRRQETFRTNNGDSTKDRTLKRAYGIGLDHYTEMLEAQGGGCAICGNTGTNGDRALCVDHDHTTGKVRGVLCSNCNTAIGMLKDSPELLSKAITYLVKQN